jgi:hypothetical protein
LQVLGERLISRRLVQSGGFGVQWCKAWGHLSLELLGSLRDDLFESGKIDTFSSIYWVRIDSHVSGAALSFPHLPICHRFLYVFLLAVPIYPPLKNPWIDDLSTSKKKDKCIQVLCCQLQNVLKCHNLGIPQKMVVGSFPVFPGECDRLEAAHSVPGDEPRLGFTWGFWMKKHL